MLYIFQVHELHKVLQCNIYFNYMHTYPLISLLIHSHSKRVQTAKPNVSFNVYNITNWQCFTPLLMNLTDNINYSDGHSILHFFHFSKSPLPMPIYTYKYLRTPHIFITLYIMPHSSLCADLIRKMTTEILRTLFYNPASNKPCDKLPKQKPNATTFVFFYSFFLDSSLYATITNP